MPPRKKATPIFNVTERVVAMTDEERKEVVVAVLDMMPEAEAVTLVRKWGYSQGKRLRMLRKEFCENA